MRMTPKFKSTGPMGVCKGSKKQGIGNKEHGIENHWKMTDNAQVEGVY